MPEEKYELEGGPGLKRCFQLVMENSVDPAKDRLQLLQWTLFNLLIGNADAHAKNLSFTISEEGIRLAPFYDLLSTRFYPKLSDRAAMAIGGEVKIDAVTRKNLESFADAVEIKPRFVLQTMEEMAVSLPILARESAAEVEKLYGKGDVLEVFRSGFAKRAGKFLKRVRTIG